MHLDVYRAVGGVWVAVEFLCKAKFGDADGGIYENHDGAGSFVTGYVRNGVLYIGYAQVEGAAALRACCLGEGGAKAIVCGSGLWPGNHWVATDDAVLAGDGWGDGVHHGDVEGAGGCVAAGIGGGVL